VSTRRRERALRRILVEVRAEAPPELDWAELEASLPEGPPVPEARASAWRPRLLLAAAALAVVAGAFAWSRGAESPEAIAMVERAEAPSGPLKGDQLAPGTAVATVGEGRTVEHLLRASWTLAPHSRATLVTSGDVVLVRLEQGSLTARIVPSPRKESFVVEAADVRVAVHGTVFTVSLDERAVGVAVEEGKVLVGPRATPGIGKLVASPASERFTLLGTPVAAERAEPATRSALRAPHPSVEPSSPASSASAPPLGQPTPEQLNQATARVVELASTCFSQRTIASDGVRVTAHTVLSYRATPAGSIEAIQFEPPLAPNVQACIDAGTEKLSVVPSAEGFRGSRVVDLER